MNFVRKRMKKQVRLREKRWNERKVSVLSVEFYLCIFVLALGGERVANQVQQKNTLRNARLSYLYSQTEREK